MEAAYKIYYSRDAEQEAVLAELLAARHQLAQLCGYRTFGHRALTNSLAQSPENTAAFLGHLAAELPGRVADDHQHVLALKRRVNPLCVELVVETVRPGELWSDDVFKLAVKSSEVGLLG